MNVYSDEEKKVFYQTALHARSAYRDRNRAGGARGWDARKTAWWRQTPERWAWLNAPNLRKRENLNNTECPDCLRWFKPSPEEECWFCVEKGVPDYPNRMCYETMKQGVSMRSLARKAEIEWRTFRLCASGKRAPHESTKLKLLSAFGLPESKSEYLFPVERKGQECVNPVFVKKQAKHLIALDAFYGKHGRMPAGLANSPSREKVLCVFLGAVRGGRTTIFPDNTELELKNLPTGWQDKKEPNANFVARQLEVLKEIDAFVVKNGREPRPTSKRKREKWLGLWLRRIRNNEGYKPSCNKLFPSNKKYKVQGLLKNWWKLTATDAAKRYK